MINFSHQDERRPISRPLISRPSCLAFALLCACALALVAARVRAQGIGTSAGGSSASPASSDASASRSRGSITVRVLDDANQPVQNALVMAFPQGRPLTSTMRPSYGNTASGAGKYVLGDLGAGLYSVSVSVPGYVSEPRPAPFDPDSPNANDPPVFYRPGDTVTMRVVKGGVITGRVTDADGNPLVGARVNVSAVRDLNGRPLYGGSGARERRTDDRGIYRLYGLSPAVYVVYAGGRSQFNFGGGRLTPYDGDAPTYYPSSAREGAVEVQVQAGQEMTDVDIRYRGDKGHAVSGTIVGLPANAGRPGSGVTIVALSHAATGALEAQTFILPDSQTHAFTLDAVADGEYELSASTSVLNSDSLSATPLHVSVHGADVSGLRVVLAPLASLAGRVVFEPLKAADAARPECRSPRSFAPQELLVSARRDDSAAQQQLPPPERLQTFSQAAPDDKGEFTLRNMRDGRYRLSVRLIDDGYYLRALTLPANATAAASAPASTTANPAANTSAATNARGAATNAAADLARSTFTLRPGDRLAGALVTISAGAASLRGRVAAAEGEQLPEGLRVYLVPAERERAEDVLRYAESAVEADGSFAFRSLAPGGYLLLARPAPASDRQRQARLPLALDSAARAALRRDAEAAKNSVTLQPCRGTDDFTLRLARQ